MHLFRRQPSEDPLLVGPPSEFMPQIPDFLDEANTGDWEKIQRQEATEEKLPTPPAKDAVYKLKGPIIHAPQPQLQRSTPSPEDESKGWDMLDSQFISNPNGNNNVTSNDHQVQIYDVDDDDVALEYSAFLVIRPESSTTEPPPVRTADFTSGILGPDTVRTNPWAGIEEIRMDKETERPPNNAEQDPEKDLPPQLLEGQADSDGESIASEASDLSNEPSDRLDGMLLLRAQMVQVESRLNLRNPDSDQEIKQTKKILRKMRRQAERRYAAGTPLAQYLDSFDDDDMVSLDGFHPKTAERKIEEKLEALLSPDATSLFVKIIIAKKANDAKKQKPNVVMLFDRYNLTLYTSESVFSKKIFIVNIPEEKFADWLTGYRILST